MIGFTQNSEFTKSLMLGFTFLSTENVIIYARDQDGNLLSNTLINFNGELMTTNDNGFVEYTAIVGPYVLVASRAGYNDFNLTDSYTSGVLEIIAILTQLPIAAFSAEAGTLLWSPVCNSFKFINSEDISFLDTESLEDLTNLDYMNFEGYCQKVIEGETRKIQFHCNGTSPMVYIRLLSDDSIVDTITPTVEASSIKNTEDLVEVAFDIYEAELFFPLINNYYISIESNAGANVIKSEPISVGLYPNSVVAKFTNKENTEFNVWNNGFEIIQRFDAQLYRLKTTSDRTVFVGSDNRGQILSQKNKRGIQMDIFHLPPYLHESLSYGFSLNTIDLDGQLFYSEEGYGSITYVDRFSLANASVFLLAKLGFGQQIGIDSPATFIVDGADNFIVDNLDNNLIQGDG